MADDFFNDDTDTFDDLVRQFFGQSPSRRTGRVQRAASYNDSDEDLSRGELIETDSEIYLIFELAGFSQKDIIISSKDGILEIKAQKKSTEDIQPYLIKKLQAGLAIKRAIPDEASKKFTHTYKNGILEVVFEK